MRELPCTFMRGGTSKGCVFLESQLPPRAEWDSVFVAAMGGADPKQIDGLGGCVSSNNKIVVIAPSAIPDVDVEYIIGQVLVGEGKVDYRANCGNMTSTVAPFAIDQGLVTHLHEPTTTVRLLNRNTNKRIDVTVPVRNQKFYNLGDCQIAGIDGTAGELRLNFLDPVGSKTGKLFPTGNHTDTLHIPGFGAIEATLLDVCTPVVLVRALDLGLTGSELPEELNADAALLKTVETIRAAACCRLGFAQGLGEASKEHPGAPKIALLSSPANYTSINGNKVSAQEMDLCVRMFSIRKAHKATPVTGAAAIAAAVLLDGTIAAACARRPDAGNPIRLGHPSGIIPIMVQMQHDINAPKISAVTVQRTARYIIQGTLFLPQ